MAFIKIQIDEFCNDETELSELLKKIADMLEEGYTSGHYPDWHIIY